MSHNMKDEALIKQLKVPTHINYISQYITKQDMQTTKEQLERLVTENLIVEFQYPGYYVDKNIINGDRMVSKYEIE